MLGGCLGISGESEKTNVLDRSFPIELDWRGYRAVTWIGIVLIALAALLALVQNGIDDAFVPICLFAASVLFLLVQDRLPALFNMLVVVAAFLNAVAWGWNLYDRFLPFDELAHTFTTLVVTLAFGFLIYAPYGNRPWIFVFSLISLGISFGALWEIIEWVGFYFSAQHGIMGIDDTFFDLIFDSLGAVAAALIGLWLLKNPSRS